MAPTTPFSIAGASKAVLDHSAKKRPIDLLAVVSRVEKRSDRLTLIHIVDPSGETHVAYYGTTQQQRIAKSLEISYGDIVRFNRISIRSELEGNDSTHRIAFHHALEEREGGMDFYRLARINEAGSVSMELMPPPPEFETNVSAIHDLTMWMKPRTKRRLTGIPCQAQQIASIQAGMTLHLRANVQAVVVVEQQHHPLHYKRKRFYPKRHRPPGCYATLKDYTGSMALFLDHRFVTEISTVHLANHNRKAIDVAHCKAFRNMDDEVLLLLTDRSTVSVIERLVERPLSSEQTQNASQEESVIVHGIVKRQQQEQVTCTIRDIVVDGVSLACHKQSYLVDDKAEELHALLRLDELRYKDVMLMLEEVSTGRRYSSIAVTTVLEKLLGDTPIDSWKSNIALQRIVIRLFRGALEDNVRLS